MTKLRVYNIRMHINLHTGKKKKQNVTVVNHLAIGIHGKYKGLN